MKPTESQVTIFETFYHGYDMHNTTPTNYIQLKK